MKWALAAVGFLIAVNFTFAQNRKITGRIVAGDDQHPVADANVVITGSRHGTATNVRGYFELSVPPQDSSLTISHVGYVTEKIKLPDVDKFQVSLRKEINLLSTIVLTTYPRKVITTPPLRQTSPNDSLNVVESLASFSKGMANFYVLAGNALYAEFKDYKHPLTIAFKVDEQGKMTDIEATDSTLNKVIAGDWKYMPPWKPAMQRGHPVPQWFLLPVIAAEPEEFYKYLTDNMIVPPQAQREGIDGHFFVSFRAHDDGKITDIKTVKGLGADYDVETSRVISGTPPDVVKSLISLTGAHNFTAVFRFELFPGEYANELSYPEITPDQYVLGELSISALRRKKTPKK
jgi:hypothetical protein